MGEYILVIALRNKISYGHIIHAWVMFGSINIVIEYEYFLRKVFLVSKY